MPTAEQKPNVAATQEPLKLKTWDEVEALYKLHLAPVSQSPDGTPIYRGTDVAELRVRLNIQYPDE